MYLSELKKNGSWVRVIGEVGRIDTRYLSIDFILLYNIHIKKAYLQIRF